MGRERCIVVLVLAVVATLLAHDAHAAPSTTAVWKIAHDGGPALGPAIAFDEARNRTVVYSDDQTWLWDGSKWKNPRPLNSPPPSSVQALAYDRNRARVVAVSVVVPNNETWEWDGTTWAKKASVAPGARLFYDEVLGKVVAIVPSLTETALSSWNGSSWTPLAPVNRPPPFGAGCFAYDSNRQRAVLFGSFTPNTPDGNDVWEWDGGDWTHPAPASPPSARSGCAMGFDGNSTVMYGGGTYITQSNEMWRWNGAQWTLLSATTFSPMRVGVMAFDRTRARLVMPGRDAGGSYYPEDTFEWDGSAWADKTDHDFPAVSGGSLLPMVYDEALGATVLVDWWLNKTWRWNGTTWSLIPTAHFPAGLSTQGLVYDRKRARVVAVFANLPQTWEFDGTDWLVRPSVTPTPKGFGDALAYDSKRSRVVLVRTIPAQTWEWDGTDWSLRASAPSMVNTTPGLAFDEARGVTVLVATTNNPQPVQTWEWDGQIWKQAFPATNPPGAGLAAYDPIRKRVVNFSGGLGWDWDGSDWSFVEMVFAPIGSVRRLAFDRSRRVFVTFAGAHRETTEFHMRGGACAGNADCHLETCVDGACCETACGGTGDCMACSRAAGALDDGLCGLVSKGTTCMPSRCEGLAFVPAVACDGVGASCPPSTSKWCAPNVCEPDAGCVPPKPPPPIADGGDDGGFDAGFDAGLDASVPAISGESLGGGGCTCAMGGASSSVAALAAASALLAAMIVRRRGRR